MFSKEGSLYNIINKPSSQGHWSVCASFWRSFSCPFCRPSLLYGTHLQLPKSTRLGFQPTQPYLDKPSSSRFWKFKMSGLHWAKIVHFILLNATHRSGVWSIWERSKKEGEGEGCSSLTRSPSGKKSWERGYFSTRHKVFLQTRQWGTPDTRGLILSFGLQAFEIAASLVGYVVEENSFFSKGFKSERCRELLLTI